MKRWVNLGIALSLAAMIGCSRDDKAEVREATRGVRQEVGSVADNARQAANNAALTAKIETALSTRKGLEGAKIDVDSTGTVVTLRGDVLTRDQAELAEKVALETEGVGSVTNELMLRVPAKPGSTTAPATSTGR